MEPNFLILGTAKAGTSSLSAYLRQHPQVFLPAQSELNFFAHEGRTQPFPGHGDEQFLQGNIVRTFAEYRAQFDSVTDQIAVGEVSTHNLYSPAAPDRIKTRFPEARLIAILRHPVDRAYSAFTHMVRDGREVTPDFRVALALEPERVAAGWVPIWHYSAMSHYGPQLRRYADTFGPDRLKAYLYDDWLDAPEVILKDLFDYIGVDSGVPVDMSEWYNVSLVPKRWWLHRAVTSPSRWKFVAKRLVPEDVRRRAKAAVQRKNLVRPSLDPGLRSELAADFVDDVRSWRSWSSAICPRGVRNLAGPMRLSAGGFVRAGDAADVRSTCSRWYVPGTAPVGPPTTTSSATSGAPTTGFGSFFGVSTPRTPLLRAPPRPRRLVPESTPAVETAGRG